MLNRYAQIGFFATALGLSACASIGSYDLVKTQSSLSSTLQTTEGLVQKAQRDFLEKKSLLENLSTAGSPNFRENQDELAARLKRMETHLNEVITTRKEMVDAKSDLASLGYQRTKVSSNDKEYPLVEDAVSRFERAAGRTNSGLVDYSRESNSLADLVVAKKLFYQFDVGEFQKRVQKSIVSANEIQKVMLRELNRADITVTNWNKPETKPEQEQLFEQMHSSAKEYSSKARQLSTISKNVQTATMGSSRISTLDKEWPEVQKLLGEFDSTLIEMQSLNERFNRQNESFRNPAKRVR